MNLSARLVAAAMAVMEMEDVLEARMVSGLQRLSSSAKMPLLDVQVLDGGLHHQIGIGSGGQLGGEAHVGQDLSLLGLVQLALAHQLIQALVQPGLAGLDDLVLDVAHHNVIARCGQIPGRCPAPWYRRR